MHRVQALFPELYGWASSSGYFTDSIVDRASPYFPVHILDLREDGFSTRFFCDVLQAEHACAERKRRDQENGTTWANKAEADIIFYDAVGLNAASKGLVNMQKWNRFAVRNAIESHMEQELNQTASLHWPRVCPDEVALNDLLIKSIRLDAHLFPNENREQRDDALKAGFQKQLDRKGFCHVDLDAILGDAKWQQWFSERFA